MSHLQKHLLVIDEDKAVAEQIRRLCAEHFQVVPVRDIQMAIDMITSTPSIQVIVAGKGKNGEGLRVLETARQRRPTALRIMLTGFSDLSAVVSGLHSGAVQHLLQRPIQPREFVNAIAPAIRAKVA